MDLVTGMRVFHAVVEAGSFTAASERLEMSPAMVTRYVAQLESHLGTRLIHRTTRKLSLTGIGADYFQRAVQILGLIEEAGLRAAQEAAEPRGLLRVTTSAIFGIGVLDHAIVEYMRRYPQVQVELSLSERIVDLVEEGFDLALRIASRVDGTMIARPIMRVPLVTCASPAYLGTHGSPRVPQDLGRHNCLVFMRSPIGPQWIFQRGGKRVTVPVTGNLRADNGRALVDAALDGLGVVYELGFVVEPYLRDGRLKRLLPGWDTVDVTVDAVWPTRKFLHPKVRTFVDFLVERFGPGERVSARSSRPA
jgi:DNA-binding transcriptional LysR family regulator